VNALRNRVAAAAMLAGLAIGVAACNSDDEGGEDQASGKAKEVRTVEVVQSKGARQSGLDASGLYDRISPGVVTILSIFGGGEGVGFAIPVDTVRRSLSELRENGRVDYGYLGVESVTLWPQAAERLKVDAESGAVLGDIQPGSPAAEADLKGGRPVEFQGGQLPVGGDVIVAVDGRRLTQRDDLADLVSTHGAGDKVELEVIRGGDKRTVSVTLGKRPDSPPDPQP